MAASILRGQLRALSNDRNLRRFIIQARPTGRNLGTGSYGAVEEVEVNGLVCAGKKIHEVLLDAGNVGVREIAAKYVQECQLMSGLRHPNITQFMGVCFLPNNQLPVLVMERLDVSLDEVLESIPSIPLILKRSILEDVAKGLLYLHKHDPQIVHRDLTAKNVLLTSSLSAKITDFGNSRIVNIEPGQLAQTLSRNPGTLVYMPPESLSDSARYGPSLDIFSFGHLGLFVALQIFPGNLLEPTYPESDNSDKLVARSEVERRGAYLQQLERLLPNGGRHPIVQLVKQCLKNTPSKRPAIEQVVASLEEMRAEIEGPYGDVARIEAVRQVLMMRAVGRRETEVKKKSDELAGRDAEIQQLQQELEHEQVERARSEDIIRQRDALLQQLQQQVTEKTAESAERDAQIHHQIHHLQEELEHEQGERARTEERIHQLETELGESRAQLQQKDTHLHNKDTQIEEKTRELQQQTAELNSVQQRLQRLRSDLDNREAQLRVQDEEMCQQSAEINRLLGELRRCQTQLLRQQESGDAEGAVSSPERNTGQQINQTPLTELKIPLKLIWRKGKDMPFGMETTIQAVVIGDNVYVGGGFSYNRSDAVMVYSLQTGSWTTLPPCGTKWFGMAVVNNQLVLVGGSSPNTHKVTKVLSVWDQRSQTWTHPFSDMPTARDSLSVVSYQKWLIVAGGRVGDDTCLEKVELLDTVSGQWYEGSPLPGKCAEMSSAINGNMWYLSGGLSSQGLGGKHVLSVCLVELISQAVSQSPTPSKSSPWQTLPEAPLEWSTPLILNGALLTVGGRDSSSIHYYQPSGRNWVKVGDLPTKLWRCACIVVPSGEIFVAGGEEERFMPHNHVHIASIV